MSDESRKASVWTGGTLPSLYYEVTREMPSDAEAALEFLAQQAGVPADGAQHRVTVDIVLETDGRVRGAIIHQSGLPSVS